MKHVDSCKPSFILPCLSCTIISENSTMAYEHNFENAKKTRQIMTNPRTRMPPPVPSPPSPSSPPFPPSPCPPAGHPSRALPNPIFRALARRAATKASEHTPGPQTATVKREPFTPHSGKTGGRWREHTYSIFTPARVNSVIKYIIKC